MIEELTIAQKNLMIAKKLMGGKTQSQLSFYNSPDEIWRQLSFYISPDEIWLPVHGICRTDTVEVCKGKILRYHDSWDWLMPVVERISKVRLLNVDGTECNDVQDTCFPITFNMPTADGKQVMFRFKGFPLHQADTLKEAVFNAVAEVAESLPEGVFK